MTIFAREGRALPLAPTTKEVAMADRKAPSMEQISRAAYVLYRERGGAHGQDVQDWVRAERALRRELAAEPVRTKVAGHAS